MVDSLTVKDDRTGKKYPLPIQNGSINALANCTWAILSATSQQGRAASALGPVTR